MLGAMFLIMGAVMVFQGFEAQKAGTIIPATYKSGPMTGLHSIITGILAAGAGIAFLGYEVYKIFKKKMLS